MKEVETKKRSLAAAQMKQKILESAAELFLKKGFDGVSISEIVKSAKINQSLIYHYFESKEQLWKEVKNYLLADVAVSAPTLDASQGLKEVLKQIVYTRYEIYAKNPHIVRLMSWQKLETPQDNLAGGTPFSPSSWKPVLQQLQHQGFIRKEVDLEMLILYICSAVSGAYLEEFRGNFQQPEKTNGYLDMVVESCLFLFASV